HGRAYPGLASAYRQCRCRDVVRRVQAAGDGRWKAVARAPDRDHDEDDLEPFEEDALEGQYKADPVAAGDGLTELVDRLLVGAVLVMHGHDARRAQHGFVQPAQA